MRTDFIIIWGFQRSGASLLAASLELFGASLGPNVSSPDESGLAGAFEDAHLVRLNDEMLRYLGLSWDTLCEVGESETRILSEAGFMKRAVAYLLGRAADGPLIGLKDPRMTRLGLFWAKAFDELDIIPYSLVCFRNPATVARYLRRGALRKIFPGFFLDTDYGQLLWLGYTLGSLLYTKKYPRVLIEYDALLTRPQEILRNAAARFQLPYREDGFAAFNEVYVSLEKNSPRTRFEDSASLIPKVDRLYRALSDASPLDFPSDIGPMWPHEEIERIMTKILAQAFRENRDLQEYIAGITEHIGKQA